MNFRFILASACSMTNAALVSCVFTHAAQVLIRMLNCLFIQSQRMWAGLLGLILCTCTLFGIVGLPTWGKQKKREEVMKKSNVRKKDRREK